MPKTILVIKGFAGALHPASAYDQEAFDSLPEGKVLEATISQPRNIKRHRFFFAVLNAVAQAKGHTTEDLLELVKTELKFFDLAWLPNGILVHRWRSISFAKMDETAFKDFIDRAFNVLVECFELDLDELKTIGDDAAKELERNAKR